ncbi:MAG TPA: type II secretion system F family protein [Phycisphaerae bacterium]|nr:type II secretion system F family protein [Phycisphaerae bacterium]
MTAVPMLAALSGAANIVFMVMPMAGSLLLAFGIYQVITDLRSNSRQKVLDRLQDRSGKGRSKGRLSKDAVIRKRTAEAAAGSLDSLVSRLSVVPKLQRVLDQAKVDWSAARMLRNLFVAAVVLGSGLVLLRGSVLTGVAAGLAVFAVPLFVLFRKRKKRMRKLVEQLPDCFELMSQALRAGHSLASGIQLVSEQMPDPIGTECARVFHEQNLGVKIEDALMAMADRCGQLDVRFFVTAVLIQRQTGGDLAEVLDKMGSVVRDRIQLMGMVQALTAEGRLSGWVLLALPVVVFFVIMYINPTYASQLLYDPQGRLMLFAAIGMQLMGMAMIKKIVNIKV